VKREGFAQRRDGRNGGMGEVSRGERGDAEGKQGRVSRSDVRGATGDRRWKRCPFRFFTRGFDLRFLSARGLGSGNEGSSEFLVEGEEEFDALAVVFKGLFAVAAVDGAVEGLVGF